MNSGDPSSGEWDERLLRNPHVVADKRGRVQRMFAAIAPSYDLNNRLHSLWMDQYWRRRSVGLAAVKAGDVVVDVACGTGDLSFAFAARNPGRVVGIDFTYPMLPLARAKMIRRGGRGAKLGWACGDAMKLPLGDGVADIVSIAFGIRNVAEPAVAIGEFYRVLRPGGRLVILEFSLPTNSVLRGLYNFYFRKVLPRTATLISGDKTGAYKYLPESVNTFIGREQMQAMMREAGFAEVEQHPLTCGVCVCYCGRKSH